VAPHPNRALAGEVPIDQLDTDLGVKEVETFSGVSPTASIADASWRICRRAHAAVAFSGEGARLYGAAGIVRE